MLSTLHTARKFYPGCGYVSRKADKRYGESKMLEISYSLGGLESPFRPAGGKDESVP
ncbi:hypothetical protein GWK48_02685 [Metallosphaera tengchongensis]|uniref:Uncharacterized protein n=1 Tax=Metallosphaera tengchongensis TaxID=1532350 RepID=A0A6N0NRE4_9CREN|nr:hypothetical protein [Metallosphaera tengchongensis]QKQ99443.1 hypothetical protein GWK48_02685 [Metallosphaera tengchongensis]